MLPVFVTLYAISSLWAILSILLYGNRPERSIGWILIVIILPILGVVLYILFGINRKKFKFFKLNFTAKRRLYDSEKSNNNEWNTFEYDFSRKDFEDIGKLIRKSSGFSPLAGNKVNLLKDGEAVYNCMMDTFKKAEKFIHLQYYILEDGKIFDALTKIFEEKIKQGVEIRVLYDALGSFGLKNKSIRKLKKLGVTIFPILPLKVNTILSTLNFRNHRKIVIIDGAIAFTGGVNISDKYLFAKASPFGIWDDLHLKIEGPCVDHLHRIFIKDYYFASNKHMIEGDHYLPKQNKKGNSVVQIVAGGPDLKYESILHQYTSMVQCANKSIFIENPYFIPNQTLLEALKMAALKGVDVQIMIPRNNDSKLAKYSMFKNFENLLETGVKIHVLKNRFSHSKLIIIDKQLASVGSGNFDYRSFEHNYEVNTLLYDEALAKELALDFENDIKNCKTLNYDSFKQRPLSYKLLEGAAKIFSPLL